MSVKIVTDFRILMQLARDVEVAKKSGDINAINDAEKKHNDYKKLVFISDLVSTGLSVGDLGR